MPKVEVFVTERLEEEHAEDMAQFKPVKVILALVEQMFIEGDTNKDGSIDPDEMAAIEKEVKEHGEKEAMNETPLDDGDSEEDDEDIEGADEEEDAEVEDAEVEDGDQEDDPRDEL